MIGGGGPIAGSIRGSLRPPRPQRGGNKREVRKEKNQGKNWRARDRLQPDYRGRRPPILPIRGGGGMKGKGRAASKGIQGEGRTKEKSTGASALARDRRAGAEPEKRKDRDCLKNTKAEGLSPLRDEEVTRLI